jgi:hypothetical protein
MPTKRTPRIAAIRSWVALGSVVVFLTVWLAIMTLGKSGVATSTASSPATTTTTDTSTSTAVTATPDTSASGQSSSSPPALDSSQS